MENKNEKPENGDSDEKAASAYRLKQAEELLKALGYMPVPNSKLRKKPDPEEEEKKFYLAGKQICPIDNEPHDFQPALSFMSEVELFEIRPDPQDLICKKCLGSLQDYMDDADE